MKVWELKKILDTVSQDAEVVLAKDAEGNSFSPADLADARCRYVEDNQWSGWVAGEKDLQGVPAVVLWPIN